MHFRSAIGRLSSVKKLTGIRRRLGGKRLLAAANFAGVVAGGYLRYSMGNSGSPLARLKR